MNNYMSNTNMEQSIKDNVKDIINQCINENNEIVNTTSNKTNNIEIHCYGIEDLSFLTDEFINSITKLSPATYILVKDKNSSVIDTSIMNNIIVDEYE